MGIFNSIRDLVGSFFGADERTQEDVIQRVAEKDPKAAERLRRIKKAEKAGERASDAAERLKRMARKD